MGSKIINNIVLFIIFAILNEIKANATDFKYSTPFSAELDNIKVFRRVKIQGFIPSTAARVTINLESSVDMCKIKHVSCVISLHFDMRFFDGEIVLNSYRYGRWDSEETHVDSWTELKGSDHIINIIILQNMFLIVIDNASTISYTHRVALNQIKKILIRGDIELKVVECKDWDLS